MAKAQGHAILVADAVAVRVDPAGLVQQGHGRFRIVGHRLQFLVEPGVVVQLGDSYFTIALQDGRYGGEAVHTHGNGLAHVDVGEDGVGLSQVLGVAQVKVVALDGHTGDDKGFHAVHLEHFGDLQLAQVVGNVHVAGAEQGDEGVHVGHHLEDDGFSLGRLERVGIGHDGDAVAGHPLLEDKGAVADGIARKLAVARIGHAFQGVLGQDGEGQDRGDKGHIGLFEIDHRGQRIGDVDGVDAVPADGYLGQGGRVDDELPGEGKVFGRHRLAVVPLDPVFELEGVG